jgi:hypothetical protein
MPNQITDSEVLAYVAESAWGTTPATPTGQIVRMTGVTPTQDKGTTKSQELSSSREDADIIQVSARGGLTVPFEASYDIQFEDWLQALLGGTWASNELKVGTTRRSFTMQRKLTDSGLFQLFTGAVPSKITLGTSIGNIVGGSAEFVSKFPSMSGTEVFTNATPYTAAGTNPVFDPIASIQLLQEGGAGAIAGATEFSIELMNGIVSLDQLASLDPLEILAGGFSAQGSFSCYLADSTYWAKFAAHTTTSLVMTLGGAASKKYSFSFAKVKLSKVDLPNQGKNNAMIQKYTWEAFKDATDTTTKITRTP